MTIDEKAARAKEVQEEIKRLQDRILDLRKELNDLNGHGPINQQDIDWATGSLENGDYYR